MISMTEAIKLILQHQKRGSPKKTSLDLAYRQVLAQDVFSPIDLPIFDASAMDGFAVRAGGTISATRDRPVHLEILEEIWAGKIPQKELTEKTCARIMTGAMLPRGTDAIVMQEEVIRDGTKIRITTPVREGSHIRNCGEELSKGDLLLPKGTRLTPPVLGLLASVGIENFLIYPKPQVTIIPTGTELIRPGETLKPGEIYESNSHALRAALEEMTITPVVSPIIGDNRSELHDILSQALRDSTHVIVCGGVSVGDRDYNRNIFADCRVEQVFWKVAQKPGKPLFFGMRNATSVFGVPGNPASSLFCFYEYIRPALLKYMGYSNESLFLEKEKAILLDTVTKKKGKTYFIRGHAFEKLGKTYVKVLAKQGSHMLSSFAQANCLLVIEQDLEEAKPNDVATIHWLPNRFDETRRPYAN